MPPADPRPPDVPGGVPSANPRPPDVPGGVPSVDPLATDVPEDQIRRAGPFDWLGLCVAAALILGGVVALATAAGWNLAAWSSHRQFASSQDGRRAAAVASAPSPVFSTGSPTPQATTQPPVASGSNPIVDLVDASFVFADSPEPGARARLTISLFVRGPESTSVSVRMPGDWFEGYRLASTSPSATIDTESDPSVRQLTFDDLAPGTVNLTLDVVETGERVDPPTTHLELTATGEAIGDAHPPTVAPRPRPGPVSALHIPRLNLNVAVVPTAWEPPAFLVGQIRTTANVMLGNTVLVGHLGGAAGDVFKNLSQLRPGDRISAVSRGLEYPFVVSDEQTRPASDSQPIGPTSSARLTLMTCTGAWDPLARNYSDRLWVTAEPVAVGAPAAPAGTPPSTPVPEAAPTEPPATTGLGAERAGFEATLGAPLGETPGNLVVYRKGASEYHVLFTADSGRAQLISMQPTGSATSLTVQMAVQSARAAFPADATPRIPAPEGSPSLVVERFTSPALPGDFVVAYTRDAAGSVTRVVVAAGDDVSAALAAASR